MGARRSDGRAVPLRTPDRAMAYERARPGYPSEAAAHIAHRCQLGSGSRVLDVGAGTGKLSRLLASTGAEVIAAEPLAAMRLVVACLRGVAVLGGRAEALGLRSAACDVVTVAQAFHWFDAPVALAEMHRVLRPGGHLFLVWNVRDTGRSWVREFNQALVECGVEAPVHRFLGLDVPGVVGSSGVFEHASLWTHAWECAFDADRLMTWVDSIGLAGHLSPSAHARLHERVQDLLDVHPDLVGRRTFGFPFTTQVWRCRAV
jgi:SAM-dependent methyltransferase